MDHSDGDADRDSFDDFESVAETDLDEVVDHAEEEDDTRPSQQPPMDDVISDGGNAEPDDSLYEHAARTLFSSSASSGLRGLEGPSAAPPLPKHRSSMPPPIPPRGSAAPPPIPLIAKKRAQSSRPPGAEAKQNHAAFARSLETRIAEGAHGHRLARLLVELARVSALHLDDLPTASVHYKRAMRAAPEMLAAVQGSRLTLCALRQFEEALPLFDAEARLLSSPRQKALLLHEKGRLLERDVGDRALAVECYRAAHELDRQNALVIRSLARIAETNPGNPIENRRELDRRLEQISNIAKNDTASRTAYTLQRAFLAEAEGDRERAIMLYEGALQGEESDVALEALDRLYAQGGRERERSNILVRRAQRTQIPENQAYLLLESGRLLERLGNELDAHQTYLHAHKAAPRLQPALEAVARTSAQTGDWKRAVTALSIISNSDAFSVNRRASACALLGHAYERHLDQRELALSAYRQSLKLRFTKEALDALRTILESDEKWSEVVSLLLLEAEEATDRNVQAYLFSRAASLSEAHLADLDRATELYQRALQVAPGSIDAFRALQRLLKERQRWRELVQAYEVHLDHAQDSAEQSALLLEIGSIYERELRDMPMASHTYERLLEIDKTSMSAVLGLQRASEHAGQYETLLAALEKEADLVRTPSRLTQILHRGALVAEHLLDDRKVALLWLKRALAVDAEHSPTLHAVARVAAASGRWEDLIEAYEALAGGAEPEKQAQYYIQISQTAGEQLGDAEKALAFARRAVAASPTTREAFDRLYEVLRHEQRWGDLAQAIQARIEAAPDEHDTAALALQAGRLYIEQLGDTEKAETAFTFARERAPHELSTWRTLEQLYENRNAWNRVEALLNDAVLDNAAALEPAHRVALATRASQLSLEQLGDPTRAADYLEVGLSIEPDNALLLHLRARLNARTQELSTSLMTHTTLADRATHPGLTTAYLHEAAELCTGDAALITLAEQIMQADPSDALAANLLRLAAARAGDSHRVGRASAALATISEDELSRSLHLSTQAEVHEQLGEIDAALDAYRMALTEDAENLAAVRGLSRVARLRDDPNLLAEAARCAAKAADEPSAAASLLTRSAHVRVHRLADPLGARRDLERALDLAPGHEQATQSLIELLSSEDDRKDLIQLLSRSANSAKQANQQRTLWLRVADLQEQSGNRTGAISALNRVLRIEPDDTRALLRLSSLYAEDRQWTEAVSLLNQVIRAQPGREHLQRAHIALARIWHQQLGDSDRARVSLRAVLALDPHNMEALSNLVRVHCDEGDSEEARRLAQRLLGGSDSPQERANGHLLLSEIEVMAGQRQQALNHALSAYEVVGPSKQSLDNVQALAQGRQDWEAYGDAISKHIESQAAAGAAPADALIHLSDLWWNQLANQKQALRVYKLSLPHADTPHVRMQYARRLVEAGSPKKATQVLRKLLARELDTPEAWRLLAKIRGREEGAYAERTCLEVVRGLGEDSSEDAERIQKAPPRKIPDVVAHERAWLMHFPDEGYASTLRELMEVISPALAKLFTTQIQEYDLDSGQDPRIERAETLCNSLCVLLDIEAIELRFHDIRAQGASFGFGSPATLFLPHGAMDWREPELCFHLARWLVAHRLGVAPVLRLSTHEVQTTLVSARRIQDKDYGSGTNSEELLVKQSKVIARAVGRKGRKRIAELAEQLREHRRILYEDWCRQMTHACERIAAVLCDDLAVALGNSPSSRDDLLRFWTSDSAEKLRQAVGLPR